MVEYYGMMLAVYPVEIVPHRAGTVKGVSVKYAGGNIEIDAREWTLWEMHLVGHERHVQRFKVLLEEVENMQVGWMKKASCAVGDCVASW